MVQFFTRMVLCFFQLLIYVFLLVARYTVYVVVISEILQST